MKKTLLFVFMLIIIPLRVSAYKIIISDETVNETIIREHFSLYLFDELFIDEEKLFLLINRLKEQVRKEPINARFSDEGEIIPAIPGSNLDQEKLIESFYQLFYNKQTVNELKLPKKPIYPKVDSELLTEISTNKLGEYVTYFKENNKERSHNIALATTAINNYILFPGETFSFNKVVGKRTKERGYKRAPVIVRGELSEDIGGGICQVSSTLFNAVNLDGINIIERYSHSRSVPYVPQGKDATVSWWGPDFVFKNQFNQPILIRAEANHGKVIVCIFSTDSVQVS